MSKNKQKRKGEILFIDARNLGQLINRRTKILTQDDIDKVADNYHNWKSGGSKYSDVQGFCKSSSLKDVQSLSYALTPGRYVGLPDEEDDFNFVERFTSLKEALEAQIAEEDVLNERILKNLASIKIKVEV